VCLISNSHLELTFYLATPHHHTHITSHQLHLTSDLNFSWATTYSLCIIVNLKAKCVFCPWNVGDFEFYSLKNNSFNLLMLFKIPFVLVFNGPCHTKMLTLSESADWTTITCSGGVYIIGRYICDANILTN
jgi:hypothetical protein